MQGSLCNGTQCHGLCSVAFVLLVRYFVKLKGLAKGQETMFAKNRSPRELIKAEVKDGPLRTFEPLGEPAKENPRPRPGACLALPTSPTEPRGDTSRDLAFNFRTHQRKSPATTAPPTEPVKYYGLPSIGALPTSLPWFGDTTNEAKLTIDDDERHEEPLAEEGAMFSSRDRNRGSRI